jgi:hypothetical protein
LIFTINRLDASSLPTTVNLMKFFQSLSAVFFPELLIHNSFLISS